MSKWLNLNGILAILSRYGFTAGSPEFSSLIEEMRSWVADCVWGEDPSELSELPDANVLLGVNRNYCGGIEAFLTDAGHLICDSAFVSIHSASV